MLKVCEHQCNQCLFSDKKIVSNSRKKQILQGCIKNDSHFECHKGTMIGEQFVCAGFYKGFSTNLIRIAGRLGVIEFINPDEVATK